MVLKQLFTIFKMRCSIVLLSMSDVQYNVVLSVAFFIVMQSVVMLRVVMLRLIIPGVIIPSVILPNVMAPT